MPRGDGTGPTGGGGRGGGMGRGRGLIVAKALWRDNRDDDSILCILRN